MKEQQLVAMRTMNMSKTHPEAKYGYVCGTCGEQMCLFPSGQRILRENPGIPLCCDVCFYRMGGTKECIIPPEVGRETQEAIDFTKRKQ
jgi:hypothetical protein